MAPVPMIIWADIRADTQVCPYGYRAYIVDYCMEMIGFKSATLSIPFSTISLICSESI